MVENAEYKDDFLEDKMTFMVDMVENAECKDDFLEDKMTFLVIWLTWLKVQNPKMISWQI